MARASLHRCLGVLLAVCAGTAASGESIERRWPHSGNGSVTVDSAFGRVEVVGWAKPEVALRGELGAGARLVEERASNAQLRLAVILDVPGDAGARRGAFAPRITPGSQLSLHVPFGVALTITGVSVDVSVRAIRNAPMIAIRTVSGDQHLAFTGRAARLKSVSGDIVLSGAAPDAALSTVSGDIELHDFVGGAQASVVSGELRVANARLGVLGLDSVSGDVEVSAVPLREARWKIESLGGDVSVAVPGGLDRIAIAADTFSGTIEADLDPRLDTSRHDGKRGKRLRTEPGAAHARILVETFSGDIFLHSAE